MANQNLRVLLTGMEPGVTTLASRSAASQYMVISCDSIISLLGTEYPPLSVEDKSQGCNGCLKPRQHHTLYANAFSSSTMVFHTITRLLKVGEIKISMHFFFKNSQKMSYLFVNLLTFGCGHICVHACSGHRTACTSQFSPPALRALSIVCISAQSKVWRTTSGECPNSSQALTPLGLGSRYRGNVMVTSQ